MAVDVKYRTEDASNNNTVTAENEDLIPKKPEVDLTFKNLTYIVNKFEGFKRIKKEILHGINGSFRSGQLTAIMGPSGCGKSTLLNVLAGYSISGSSGSVYLNDELRSEKQMSNISCYIQQDDYVRDLLTVRESMTVAAHLKLSSTISTQSKICQVEDLLDVLGLTNHSDTVTKRLSGGQKKRLSIALELITNPSILFLDEPTTGLDSQSTSQFVSLMVSLAHNQNRTMICTLHQPSALLFEKFDQVYALSSGQCIYQGPPNMVIPYFAERNIKCPLYHNPADLLIEVAIGEYGADVLKQLIDSTTQNPSINSHHYNSINSDDEESQLTYEILYLKNYKRKEEIKLSLKTKLTNKPPCYLQIYHLYLRNVIVNKRNKTNLLSRIMAHFIVAIIFGFLFYGVGDNAAQITSNRMFFYGTNLFLVYTGQMAVIVSFPLEYKVLMREYFNGWFSLFSYMISTLLVEIPFQALCCLVYIVPSYLMTNQPIELMRFCYVTIFLVLTSLTSQSTGFLFGCSLPVKVSVFVGPVFLVLLSVFGFAIRFADIPPAYLWLYYFSFIRSSFQSIVFSIYGFIDGLKRENLHCPSEYCHYKTPSKFLTDMEFSNNARNSTVGPTSAKEATAKTVTSDRTTAIGFSMERLMVAGKRDAPMYVTPTQWLLANITAVTIDCRRQSAPVTMVVNHGRELSVAMFAGLFGSSPPVRKRRMTARPSTPMSMWQVDLMNTVGTKPPSPRHRQRSVHRYTDTRDAGDAGQATRLSKRVWRETDL